MTNYDYDTIGKQIWEICLGGSCNVLDTVLVQRAANDAGFYDLVVFIEENRKGYVNFIFKGEFD